MNRDKKEKQMIEPLAVFNKSETELKSSGQASGVVKGCAGENMKPGETNQTGPLASPCPPFFQQDEREQASRGASRKMKLILQCVGSLAPTPDLADEMNRVEAAVEFVAAQEHSDSEKSRVLAIASRAISAAELSPSASHIIVRISGVSKMTVSRTVCIVKAVMTAASDACVAVVIHLRDPDRPTRAAQIEVMSEDDSPFMSVEDKRQALLEHLELYPDESGLRFVSEDVLAYIADPQRVSPRIRLVIQALGASEVTEEAAEDVERVLLLSRDPSLSAPAAALDFSYLVDIDREPRETGTARMRFELNNDKHIPQTLYLIQLVLEACVEAGASLLEIELVDGSLTALLSVSPMLSANDTARGSFAGAKLAVVAPSSLTSRAAEISACDDGGLLQHVQHGNSAGDDSDRAQQTVVHKHQGAHQHQGPEPSGPLPLSDASRPASGAATSLQSLQVEPFCQAPLLDSCSWFFPDSEYSKSAKIVSILEALGALDVHEANCSQVQELRRSALTPAAVKQLSPQDLSFVTDLDEDNESVSLTFDTSASDAAAALSRLQLVLQGCIDAGASSLYLELTDADVCATVAVTLNGTTQNTTLSSPPSSCAPRQRSPRSVHCARSADTVATAAGIREVANSIAGHGGEQMKHGAVNAHLQTTDGPRHALARKARQLIADFVSLSPEQIAAQIEEEGDEDMIFGLGHGLLDLVGEDQDTEKLRMKLYDDTMKFIETFSPQDRCVPERTRKLRVLQLNAKRLLLALEANKLP